MDKQKQKYSLVQDFLDNLVELFVGQKIEDISEEDKKIAQEWIVPLYIDFTLNYITKKYSKLQSSKVRSLINSGDERILDRNPEINPILGESLDKFIELHKNKNK